MAIMSAPNREVARRSFIEPICTERESVGITKPDVNAALAAVDQWVSDNAAAFNLALPVAARSGLTASQKARLLACVVLQRFTSGT